MNGCELIAEERKRQIEKEGWTPEHDAKHDAGDLEAAAAAYALCSVSEAQFGAAQETHFNWMAWHIWPWSMEWWKPKDRLRNLVRAGALIAAAIDRLQREA